VKRAIVIALSVLLALVLAAPMATAQKPSKSQVDLGKLTAEWWNWTASQEYENGPGPLEGSYEGGEQCDGEYVDGVFFLAGTLGGDASRTCTVPANTPILFPVFNVVCSEAYGASGQDPADPTPYTDCAKDLTDSVLANGDTYATLDGKTLKTKRVASGPFDWNIQDKDNPFTPTLLEGTWDSASDGLWVYLPSGLKPGEYTLEFGGSFFDDGFSLNTTYDLIVE